MSEEVKLSANAQKILDAVSDLTVLELSDLIKAMEDKFGVTAAPAAVAMAPAAGGEAGGEAEKTSFDVVLTSAGGSKIGVIKIIKEIAGLGLKEAKALADNGGNVKEGVSKDEAEEVKAKLEEAGATVEVK